LLAVRPIKQPAALRQIRRDSPHPVYHSLDDGRRFCLVPWRTVLAGREGQCHLAAGSTADTVSLGPLNGASGQAAHITKKYVFKI